MSFQLTSDFVPTGDQPEAIRQLVEGLQRGDHAQTLLGVTGSGKTFTIANVISQIQKPTLILSHNKTLVAQLYSEFKTFFPDNAVEYFVSYYDYYQPEAFIPSSNTYIEKDLNINEEIEKFRLRTTSTLLSGRRDVIVVSSVSCIYGAGNPADFEGSIIRISKGQKIVRKNFLYSLVDGLYSRTTAEFKRGNFRVQGETVDVFPAYADLGMRFEFFGDEVESIRFFEPETGKVLNEIPDAAIYPANIYVTPRERLQAVFNLIQDDMMAQVQYFKSMGRFLEAKRLEDRVTFDLEMMRELGYCNGIENYSRYMDDRRPGDRPFCLIDYFPDDFLLVVDESHVTIPQVHGMYGGDRSRKQNLVEYGFRLPAAMDNRPLRFEEFYKMIPQAIYVSATPADYELAESDGIVVEQLIRPTGILDPIIEIRPCVNQVDDLLGAIQERIEMGDRILVTTLTKRMAEELVKFMSKLNIRCSYIHSEVKTLDRVEILRSLRMGDIDVLVGVNLLREGLDLPEVSLVAIMDADKEGFLRSERSLTQTIGRAARNERGLVILYADKMTASMRRTIDETDRRREKQFAYNTKWGITPKSIHKRKEEILSGTSIADSLQNIPRAYIEPEELNVAADPVVAYMDRGQLEKAVANAQKQMLKAAKDMDFMQAAKLRDEYMALKKRFDEM